jgi:hypothetical protein
MKTFFRKLMDNWRVLKGSDSNRGYYISMQDKMTVGELAKVLKSNKQKSRAKDIEETLKKLTSK